MRIGLDARTVYAARPRGTGRNLRDAYERIARGRPGWRFIHFDRRRPTPPALIDAPNIERRPIETPGDRFDAWFQFRLPLAARAARLDVLHLPANRAPLCSLTPLVVTIHDLAPLLAPGESTPAEKRAFRRGVSRAVAQATRIIVPSEATAWELTRRFEAAANRIRIIPWAPDTRHCDPLTPQARQRERARLATAYGLDRRWLLNFSGRSPRKNAPRILRAWACVEPRLRQENCLLMVGVEPADFRAHLVELATSLGVSRDCRIVGFASDEDVRGLLQCAAGLLLISLMEGFGLPVLDAMACGVPALASNRGSLPELVGEAGLLCDPAEESAIARGMTRLLDPALAVKLANEGRKRAAAYSWERVAEAMCDVYAQCAFEAKAKGRVRSAEGRLAGSGA